MQTLKLQTRIIYGPVTSRRLGRSLGINISPTPYKLCSFDCVYCHYGRTQVKTDQPKENSFPGINEVLVAVEEALALDPMIDYLTFSGNGEPTLHPRFPAIVAGVRTLRDQLCPDVKLALLSNSTTAHLPRTKAALALIDVPIMKLDAGNASTLASINRPAPAVRYMTIQEGLREIPGITIQSMLVAGKLSNITEPALQAWMNALTEIQPEQIQIYSTDRPVPEAGVERISPDKLQRIANQVETIIRRPTTAYWFEEK
jgi:wyosine [tRNA(Phe)-imidazoG37] synthetase (radical SAM superfamily)